MEENRDKNKKESLLEKKEHKINMSSKKIILDKSNKKAVINNFSSKFNIKIAKTKIILYNLLALFLLAGVFYIGVAWGKHLSRPTVIDNSTKDFIQRLSNPRDIFVKDPELNKPEKIDFDIFWDVWKKVDNDYVSQNVTEDTQNRVYGAVKGMVRSLGDPYSVFFDPKESEIFTTELDGKFIGIGAELTIKDGILTVVAPIEGMPAEKAGLLAGDSVFKIYEELTNI